MTSIVSTSFVRMYAESNNLDMLEQVTNHIDVEFLRQEFNISFSIENSPTKIFFSQRELDKSEITTNKFLNSIIGQIDNINLRFGRQYISSHIDETQSSKSIYSKNDVKFVTKDDDLYLSGFYEINNLYVFMPCSDFTLNAFIKRYYAGKGKGKGNFDMHLSFDNVSIIEENEYVVYKNAEYTDCRVTLSAK